MSKVLQTIFFTLLILSSAFSERIHLKQANVLKGGTFEGKKINKVIGNVVFEHESTILYCDSAYQYVSENKVVAFGRMVKLVHQDSITVTGTRLNYNGDTKTALMTGEKVILTDNSMNLESTNLNYNTNSGIASYHSGGVVHNDGAVLNSKEGRYLTGSKTYFFKDSVDVFKGDYHLSSDTLEYNTVTQVATYFGPTHITSSKECVYAKRGKHDFKSDESFLNRDAVVENDEFSLLGDWLYYNSQTGDGHALKNVRIRHFQDSITVFGEEAVRNGYRQESKVYTKARMEKLLNGDTVLLSADTLVSINDTASNKNYIYAFNKVRMYKKDLQASCDSMYYPVHDSIIHFIRNPIIWNQSNQVTADSIYVTLSNGVLDKMYARVDAYVISEEDTSHNFNQVKGKRMVSHFKDGEIYKVDVDGNGQSLYFAKDDKTSELIGMNKVICSNMIIRFQESELSDITFLAKPESNFIPEDQLMAPERRLKGFEWYDYIRPTKNSVLAADKE